MTAKEQAIGYHHEGYNCTQAVLLAARDEVGLDEHMAASIAAGFGGGVKSGELCGAISGAVMALGLKYGAENRAKIYELDQTLVEAFREKFGAVRCADLKAGRIPCDELIAFAAEKTQELLNA